MQTITNGQEYAAFETFLRTRSSNPQIERNNDGSDDHDRQIDLERASEGSNICEHKPDEGEEIENSDAHRESSVSDAEEEDAMETLETNLEEFARTFFENIDTEEDGPRHSSLVQSEKEEETNSNTSERESIEDNLEEILELKQNRRPVKGENILYFCKIRNSWQIIKLLTNAFPRYLNKGWFYNFQFQDGSTAGNYLHPGKPYWGLLSEEQASTIDLNNIIPELGPVNENIGQTRLGLQCQTLV